MDERLIRRFVEAIKADRKKPQPYDTKATVKRVEGKTAFVQYAGADTETPVQMGVAVKEGDNVVVRNSGGRAYVLGNTTAPPTDDAVAIVADNKATKAKDKAETADRTASQARVIAEVAQDEITSTNERVQGLDDSVKDSLGDINTALYGDDDESGFQGLLESAITNIENLSDDYSQLWNNVY